MERPGRSGPALLALALLLPAIARADTYVLAPLDCPDPEASANVTSLISAELDFQPSVDSVKEIRTEPSGASCLGSTTCLGALLREGGGQRLITGTLSTSSTVYKLDLVLFDGSRVLTRKQFELPASPTEVADGMTGVVRDLLKGGAAVPAAAATAAYAFGDEGDEDIDIDEGPTAAERAAAERAAAAEEARRVAAAEEARRVEEERRLAADRARREEEERLASAEAARRAAVERDEAARRAEAERRAAIAAVAANDEFDPESISFATSTHDIKVESAEDIHFAAYADLDEEEDLGPSRSSYDDELDEDLDEDRPVQHRSEPTPSHSSRQKPASEARHAVGIVARGGYSNYYQLGFLTYGGELAIPLAQTGLYAVGGMEAYSTNRTLPVELQEQLGRTHAWDTIFPFNVGMLYKFDRGHKLVPFVGADAIFGQYYVDPETNSSAWTVGARARFGLDIYFTRVFGLDINASAGFWHGGSWTIIDQGMKNTGFLPQISAGAAFRF